MSYGLVIVGYGLVFMAGLLCGQRSILNVMKAPTERGAYEMAGVLVIVALALGAL